MSVALLEQKDSINFTRSFDFHEEKSVKKKIDHVPRYSTFLHDIVHISRFREIHSQKFIS